MKCNFQIVKEYKEYNYIIYLCMCMMRVVIAPNGFFLSCKSRFILVQKPDPSLVRFTVFFCGVQVCPEVWASFDLTGVLRLRRRLKG